MKIAINAGYGGFGLSPVAIKRLAELKGRECYFFRQEPPVRGPYVQIEGKEDKSAFGLFFHAFDIPNPNDVMSRPSAEDWVEMSMDERMASNEAYKRHTLDQRPDDRTDPDLIRVIEELGSERASGPCAKLKIIEIPDGIEWQIDEYDGWESVHEKHASWY